MQDELDGVCAQHYDVVIVVLFNVQVGDRRYEEWERGIKNTFKGVRIVCR